MQTSTNNRTDARKRKIRGIVERGLRRKTPHVPAANKTSLKTSETSSPLHSAPQDSSCWRWWALMLDVKSGKNPATHQMTFALPVRI